MSRYAAPVAVTLWKKIGLIAPALVDLHHMFNSGLSRLMFFYIMRLVRSPNVTITSDNFTQDVKSGLVTSAHPLEAVIDTICLTSDVRSEAPW
jgi:hypothetical protein